MIGDAALLSTKRFHADSSEAVKTLPLNILRFVRAPRELAGEWSACKSDMGFERRAIEESSRRSENKSPTAERRRTSILGVAIASVQADDFHEARHLASMLGRTSGTGHETLEGGSHGNLAIIESCRAA